MKIHSIFPSINGEICRDHQGSLTVFVRTFGCNCFCSWCDSKFSYLGMPPREMKVREIVKEVRAFGCKNVTITGGEPLLQKGTLNLIKELLRRNYNVSVETNGSKFIPWISDKVCWVADYKLPSSGCEDQMETENFENLTSGDFIKFVVATREDFDVALKAVENFSLRRVNPLWGRPKFAFSPVWGSLKPETLAQWMIENKYLCGIGAIYSLQIHKILNVL